MSRQEHEKEPDREGDGQLSIAVVGSEAPSSAPQVPRRSTVRVLVSGTSWNALAQFAPVVINIVMTPYLIDHLGVERWGLIALVSTIQTILGSFDGGLTESTTRYFAVFAGTDDRAQTTRTLVTVLVAIFAAGVVIGSIGWLITPTVVRLLSMPHSLRSETVFYLRAVIVLIALIFARNCMAAVVLARQRYAFIGLLSLGTYFIWIAGLIITVNEGWGLRGVAVTFLAQQFVSTVVIVPQAMRYLDRSAVGFMSRPQAREFFTYSGQIQVYGLSRVAGAEIPSLVIGVVLSVHALAMYATGLGLASQVGGIFGNAVGPAGVHLARTFGAEGDSGARRHFERIQKVWVFVCNGVFAVGIGASYFVIINWLGSGFSQAGVIATVMVAAQGALVPAGIFALYCVTVGRADIEMRVGIVFACTAIALTAGLVFAGVYGVVTAGVMACLAASWFLVHDARKRIDPNLPYFLQYLSVRATVITVTVVFGTEYLIHPYVPVGPIGLLLSGGPCLLGLAVFVVTRIGPRVVISALSEALQNRSEGLLAVGQRLGAVVSTAVSSSS